MILFLGVLAVSVVPFYLLGGSDRTLESVIGVDLPWSALMFVCPAVAALTAVTARQGVAGAARWTARAVTRPRHGSWPWVVAVLTTMPALFLVAMLLGGGDASDVLSVSPLAILALSAVFLVTGFAEQLGWTGYARQTLTRRRAWPLSALLIGLCWAAIHVVPWMQAGHDTVWVAGQSLFTVGLRVVLDFFVQRLGADVVTATVGQASSNVAWTALAEATGGYDPVLTGALTAALATLLVAVDRRTFVLR